MTSFIFIRLDALVISGVPGPLPAQNSLSPPPEPVDSMIGALKPLSALPNSSATTVAKGYTVEDPTILMVSLASALPNRLKETSKNNGDKIFFMLSPYLILCNYLTRK